MRHSSGVLLIMIGLSVDANAQSLDENENALRSMQEAVRSLGNDRQKLSDEDRNIIATEAGACWLQRGTVRNCFDLTYTGCRKAAQASGSIISSWVPGRRCPK